MKTKEAPFGGFTDGEVPPATIRPRQPCGLFVAGSCSAKWAHHATPMCSACCLHPQDQNRQAVACILPCFASLTHHVCRLFPHLHNTHTSVRSALGSFFSQMELAEFTEEPDLPTAMPGGFPAGVSG